MIVKTGVNVVNVENGLGRADMVSVNDTRSVRDTIYVMAIYVPQRPNKWPITKH